VVSGLLTLYETTRCMFSVAHFRTLSVYRIQAYSGEW
jgi:hypothetical protein